MRRFRVDGHLSAVHQVMSGCQHGDAAAIRGKMLGFGHGAVRCFCAAQDISALALRLTVRLVKS